MNGLRTLVILLSCTGLATADNWPAWRGPSGDGQCVEKNLPTTWSPTKNIRWKVKLLDQGNSTPVVWGDRIFITQASEKTVWPPPNAGGPATAQERAVMCFHRADGRLLWKKVTIYKEKESTHPTNPFCSASPVTDGERVIASLGSAGAVCYDMDGKELWRKELGKLEHIWGNASSPILYKNLAIFWCGPGQRQFLLAVDKTNGKKVWRHDEPGGKDGYKGTAWRGSWTTPLVVKVGQREELILGVPDRLKAFDPSSGKELWSCSGMGPLAYASAVCSPDGVIVAFSGFHGAAMAVRAGGSGDVTKTHRLWHHTKQNPQRIGSPVIVGDHVYLLNENGVASCFELKTGKEVAKERVGTTSWSSMVAAEGRLYVASHSGDTFVLTASPKLEKIAVNPLNERILSSIAISNGELFVRGYKHLWCIGTSK
jgi:outer membrane protein assembly factor BamB